MNNIKILRINGGVKNSHKLNKEEILNIEWTPNKPNFSDGVYQYYIENVCYILYFPEYVFNHNDFFKFMQEGNEDYFDSYSLTEEEFQFLKLKIP